MVAASTYVPTWDTLLLVATPFDPATSVSVSAPPWPGGFKGSVPGGPGTFAVLGAERSLYYADNTYFSQSADTPASQWFAAKLTWAFNYQSQLFQGDEPGQGSSRVGTGNITLANEDGGLAALLGYGWDGRSLRLYRGNKANAFSTFELIFVGTGDGLEWTDRAVTIRLRDRQAPFTKAMLVDFYGGSADLDGDSSITGQAKPLAYGRCFNIPATQIGSANQIYQASIGPIQSIDAVRDKGVVLTPSVDYPDFGSLLLATVAPGSYATCLAQGVFRLGAQPSGLVTCDVHGLKVAGTYVETAATITQAIATTRLGTDNFSTSSITGIAALDVLQPAPLGWFCQDASLTIGAALDQILGSIGGYWFASLAGNLEVGRLDTPVGATPDFSLRPRNFVDGISRTGIKAVYRRQVGYQKLERVQTPDELAAPPGVSDADRQYYGAESRWAQADRANVFTMHRYSRAAQVRGLFALQTDAQAEAERLGDLYDSELNLYQARVTGVDPFSIHLGRAFEIASWDVAGINSAGQNFRIVGMTYDVSQDALNLTFWGL